jgi:hypothetical protein
MGCLYSLGDSALVSAYESEVEEEEGGGVDLLAAVRVADGPLFSFSSDLEAALMGLTIQVAPGMFIPRILIFFPSRIQQQQKRGREKIICPAFFCSHNFRKI